MTTGVNYMITWHPQSVKHDSRSEASDHMTSTDGKQREMEGFWCLEHFYSVQDSSPWHGATQITVQSSHLSLEISHRYTEIFISMVNLTPIILTIKINDCHF